MKVYSNYNLPKNHEDYCEHPEYVDIETGEIKKGYPPSVVDESQYIEMEALVKKYINTGEARFIPQYEIDGSISDPDEAIDQLSPHRSDGFDLADTTAILRAGESARKKLADQKKAAADKKSKEGSLSATAPSAPAQATAGTAGAAVPGPEGAR